MRCGSLSDRRSERLPHRMPPRPTTPSEGFQGLRPWRGFKGQSPLMGFQGQSPLTLLPVSGNDFRSYLAQVHLRWCQSR
jgi:hypothetical protein